MMGAEGLKASQVSILNANYISKKLSNDYKFYTLAKMVMSLTNV